MRKSKRTRGEGSRLVEGYVVWQERGKPVSGAAIEFCNINAMSGKALKTGRTDRSGRFQIRIGSSRRDAKGAEPLTLYAVIRAAARTLLSTADTPIHVRRRITACHFAVPESVRNALIEGRRRAEPNLEVGPFQLHTRAFERARPEVVLDLARAMIDPRSEKRFLAHGLFGPGFSIRKHMDSTLCGAALSSSQPAAMFS